MGWLLGLQTSQAEMALSGPNLADACLRGTLLRMLCACEAVEGEQRSCRHAQTVVPVALRARTWSIRVSSRAPGSTRRLGMRDP